MTLKDYQDAARSLAPSGLGKIARDNTLLEGSMLLSRAAGEISLSMHDMLFGGARMNDAMLESFTACLAETVIQSVSMLDALGVDAETLLETDLRKRRCKT